MVSPDVGVWRPRYVGPRLRPGDRNIAGRKTGHPLKNPAVHVCTTGRGPDAGRGVLALRTQRLGVTHYKAQLLHLAYAKAKRFAGRVIVGAYIGEGLDFTFPDSVHDVVCCAV